MEYFYDLRTNRDVSNSQTLFVNTGICGIIFTWIIIFLFCMLYLYECKCISLCSYVCMQLVIFPRGEGVMERGQWQHLVYQTVDLLANHFGEQRVLTRRTPKRLHEQYLGRHLTLIYGGILQVCACCLCSCNWDIWKQRNSWEDFSVLIEANTKPWYSSPRQISKHVWEMKLFNGLYNCTWSILSRILYR